MMIIDTILTFSTEWLIYVAIISVLLTGLLWWCFKTVLKVGFTILTTYIAANILKYVFNTPRPAEAVTYFIYDPGFPSGHTAVLAALGMVVLSKNRFLGIIILGLALIVGLARVASGIHFPIDIVGGFVIGSLIGFIFSRWLKV